jgi:hypothetical protein
MRELDSGNGDGRIAERLETGHRGAAPFDRAMVLLNYIVEVPAAPDLDIQPLRIFPSDAAAANTEDAKSLGPVRAELVQVVEAVRDHTDGSIPHVMLTLHRLGDVLDALSDPVIREARAHLTSSVSMVRELLRGE